MNIVKRDIRSLCQDKMRHTKETFEYLKEKILCSLYNEHLFKVRVKEIYFERNWDEEAPNIYDIAEDVDEENIATITEFYREYDYTEVEIDQIISHYNTIITIHLDDWIETHLHNSNFPYTGSAYGSTIKKETFRDKLYMLDAAQQILFSFML